MKKTDVQCPACGAGYRRIELNSTTGQAGTYRCQVCDQLLETFDGTNEVAYRLTVIPEKVFD
jgi:transposase-like protein